MKRIFVLLMFGLLTSSTFISAQNRSLRKSNIRHSRTTNLKKSNTPKIENRPKTIAVYDVRNKSIAVRYGYILYVEDSQDNPIKAINEGSGITEIVMPGIAKVYEGARPFISRAFMFAGSVLLEYGNGVCIYNGKSFESSPILSDWEEIRGYSDKYAFIQNHQAQYELWDLEKAAQIIKYKAYNSALPEYGRREPVFIASDRGIWYKHGNSVSGSIKHLNTFSGEINSYTLAKEEYVRKNHVTQFGRIRQYEDYLYVACGRRIYRMYMLSPGIWEEFAKIPITEDSEFKDFCIAPNGNMLAVGHRVFLYRKGAFDNPQLLGTDGKIKTGLQKFDYTDIWLLHNNLTVDENNNFIIYDNNRVYIYNPDGIVGFTETYGKVTELR